MEGRTEPADQEEEEGPPCCPASPASKQLVAGAAGPGSPARGRRSRAHVETLLPRLYGDPRIKITVQAGWPAGWPARALLAGGEQKRES